MRVFLFYFRVVANLSKLMIEFNRSRWWSMPFSFLISIYSVTPHTHTHHWHEAHDEQRIKNQCFIWMCAKEHEHSAETSSCCQLLAIATVKWLNDNNNAGTSIVAVLYVFGVHGKRMYLLSSHHQLNSTYLFYCHYKITISERT